MPDRRERMKAAAIDRFGPPSVLTLHELPVPKPGPREVLIALDTAGNDAAAYAYRASTLVASPREFAKLNHRLSRFRVRVPIAATHPLAKAAQAHRRLDQGQVVGRIVLRITRGSAR